MFKRHWQNPVLFCHFLEITQDIQTGYTTAKFHISWRRGRRASHFLHWSFVGKNPIFSHLTAKNWQNWQVWAPLTKSSPFLSVLGNYTPRPNRQYHDQVPYIIYPQSFNAQTDSLSFLFIRVCETWPRYYRFGPGAFPKWYKKDWSMWSEPKHANFADFWHWSAKIWEFLPTKF